MTLPTRLENHDAGQGRPCTGINQPAQAIIQPGRRAHEPALQWGERRERPACRSPLTSPLNWNGTQAVPYKILFDSQKIPRFRRNGGFRVSRGLCRGDQWSPADFAKAKSVAVRRKYILFPSGKPKNCVFRRAIKDRPYIPGWKTDYLWTLPEPSPPASFSTSATETWL